MKVYVRDTSGHEEAVELEEGAKLSQVVPDGQIASLGGNVVTRAFDDVELRAGDHVVLSIRSGKAGR